MVTGEGLDELTAALRGRVSVVAGPSGAGKSTIINALRLRSLGLEGSLENMAAEASAPAPPSASSSGGALVRPQRPSSSNGTAGHPRGQDDWAAGGEDAGEGAEEAAVAADEVEDAGDAGPPSQSVLGAQLRRAAAARGVELPGDLELQSVGQVSRRIGRGRHTTRNVTLLELGGGGLVVDTPGFNQPVLTMPPGELAEHFPEIRRRLEDGRR